MSRYTISTDDGIPHYTDCGHCAGFGVYQFADDVGAYIVTKEDVANGLRGTALPCHHCGSTEKGVPSLASLLKE
jgi:hypothetical protein